MSERNGQRGPADPDPPGPATRLSLSAVPITIWIYAGLALLALLATGIINISGLLLQSLIVGGMVAGGRIVRRTAWSFGIGLLALQIFAVGSLFGILENPPPEITDPLPSVPALTFALIASISLMGMLVAPPTFRWVWRDPQPPL